jgi:putative tryptophan/tyrosine transport system substrate-binding protein
VSKTIKDPLRGNDLSRYYAASDAGGGMKRRVFIAALGGAAAWPIAARAQQPAMPVIGFFSVGSPETTTRNVAAFRQGLSETGYVEGQNVTIEYRWGRGNYNQMPALAAELVARGVDVIVTPTSGLEAKAATVTIPIVQMSGDDPVRSGLVASFNRPGGNVTGVGLFSFSLGAKRFELLRELIPKAAIIALLVNPSNPNPGSVSSVKEVEAAALAVGQQISILNASSEHDFDLAFELMVQQGASPLLVMADPFFWNRRERLVSLASRHSIPAIYEWREFVTLGGLMSYGSSLADAFRKLGVYAGKILKGAKPADLPIDQAVKVELVLNLKTAKALGITFPLSLLGRADEVIE